MMELGVVATATAPRICAHRPPPRSRIIKPASSTTIPSARTAKERRPKQCQRDVRQKRRDRWPGNVSPGQVTCSDIHCDQFVLMEAVLSVGRDLQQNAQQCQQYQNPSITQYGSMEN